MVNSNYMTVPEVRDRLRELADELYIDELRDIANSMYRRKLKNNRAPRQSNTVTPQMRADIRRYAKNNPKASNQEIANYFGVNPGRVSDAFERG